MYERTEQVLQNWDESDRGGDDGPTGRARGAAARRGRVLCGDELRDVGFGALQVHLHGLRAPLFILRCLPGLRQHEKTAEGARV